MKIWKPSDILKFGKNKGYSLAEVYQYEPTYIEWLVLNIAEFKIDIEEFLNLPKPTPISRGVVSGSKEIPKTKNGVISIGIMDNINAIYNVKSIKDEIEYNPAILEDKIVFKFSKEVIEKNNNK